ncbi:MAG TPA: ComEC/Rec2 family competence protein [Candidatus Saccharibacteria bacterium]|nr:ComEC/Rec2 family competence protein [Candidatus Saccharibacteria bacterium]
MKLLGCQLRRTTGIAIVLTCFLLGIGAARRLQCDAVVCAVLVALVLVTARKKNTFSILSIAMLSFALGCWRGTAFMQRVVVYQQFAKTPVIVQGIVDSDAVYADKSQLSFDVAQLRILDPVERPLVGKISVKGYGETMVYKGDVVQVEGKLFPTRGSKQASVGFAEVRVLERGSAAIDKVRRNFASGMTSALPEPQASFGLGLLIGQRTTLPKSLTDQLSTVGLTHIVAVSGYNLTIIMLVVHRLTAKRSKYQSAILSLSLIITFLLLTGTSASIVRAAIVSALGLAAWYYGRTFRPIVLILIAATLTAGWYPIYLWSDLGWYLSFLAFFGILVVGPLFSKRYFKKQPRLVLQILIEASAAQIMTLPLILYIFGRLSVVSLVANALVVPLVPLAMLLSLVAGLGGMLAPAIAGWLAWPAHMVLAYMIEVVRLLAGLPHAAVARSVSLGQMLFLYGLIILLAALLWKKTAQNGKITDRKQSLLSENS